MVRFAEKLSDKEIKRRMCGCIEGNKLVREFALLLRELKLRERDRARKNRLKYCKEGDSWATEHFVGKEIALNRLLGLLDKILRGKGEKVGRVYCDNGGPSNVDASLFARRGKRSN